MYKKVKKEVTNSQNYSNDNNNNNNKKQGKGA